MEWVSVEERLPEIGVEVLVCGSYRDEQPEVMVARQVLRGEWDDVNGESLWSVTLWMPLPEIPKEQP